MIRPHNFDQQFYQFRIGNYCYIRDYRNIAGKRSERKKAFIVTSWKFRQLTPYWFDYIIHQGYDEFMPIMLTNNVISLLDNFFSVRDETSFKITNTPFVLAGDSDGYDVIHDNSKLFRIKYLHQLQNAYFLMTGVELHDNGLEIIFPELPDERKQVVPWVEQQRNKSLIHSRVERAVSL